MTRSIVVGNNALASGFPTPHSLLIPPTRYALIPSHVLARVTYCVRWKCSESRERGRGRVTLPGCLRVVVLDLIHRRAATKNLTK